MPDRPPPGDRRAGAARHADPRGVGRDRDVHRGPWPRWSRSGWPTSRWPPLAGHVTIGSLPLYLFGNGAWRGQVAAAAGQAGCIGAFGLTEPDAGSDARGILHQRRAARTAAGSSTGARHSSRTPGPTCPSVSPSWPHPLGRGEPPRYGSFVVEKGTPGSPWARRCGASGGRASTPRAYFDDVWVPADHLVGDPDVGLGQFLRTLEMGQSPSAAVAQPGPGRAGPGGRLRPAAGAVRPADRQAPGRAVQARRHRHRARSGPLAHLPRRAPPRHRPAVPEGGGHGQAQGQPHRGLGGVRGRAGPRRARLHARLTGERASATPRSWRSARAPTRSSTWSSPASWGC